MFLFRLEPWNLGTQLGRQGAQTDAKTGTNFEPLREISAWPPSSFFYYYQYLRKSMER